MTTRRMRFPEIIIHMAVASSTLLILFRNLGRELASFGYLWGPLTLFVVLLFAARSYNDSKVRWVLLYGLINIGVLQFTLWSYMTEPNVISMRFEFLYILIAVVIFNYFKYYNETGLELLARTSLYFILISLFLTNIILFVEPEIVRQSAASGYFSESEESYYRNYGVIGYSFAQAIIALIPVLIYLIRCKDKPDFPKIILYIMLFLILIIQIRSQVFANLIATIIVTTLSLVKVRGIMRLTIGLTIVIIVFSMIPEGIYSNILMDVADIFPYDTEIHKKFVDFANFIQIQAIDDSTGLGGRAARYPLLIYALLTNPLTGFASAANPLDILPGAHLFWMNRLALLGVLGFGFYLFVLYKVLHPIYKMLNLEKRYFFFLAIISFCVIGLMKAIGGQYYPLFLIVVVPGLLMGGGKENKK